MEAEPPSSELSRDRRLRLLCVLVRLIGGEVGDWESSLSLSEALRLPSEARLVVVEDEEADGSGCSSPSPCSESRDCSKFSSSTSKAVEANI